MTCKEIMTNYLKDNGYDGLLNIFIPCSCIIDDLFICKFDENFNGDCVPAYKYNNPDCKKYEDPCDAHGIINNGYCMKLEKE